jgi:hypothetical protein
MGTTKYTVTNPLPAGVPRQLAVDMLHSHGEIIELNPLVLEHHPIKAPNNASPDEYYSAWHEITEHIQYIPGISGKVTFNGVFHDMPWGLQTHVYAPAGVDLKNKYQIKGYQPGEARTPRELGEKGPIDGLYLQEDVEITCNFAIASYVKKNVQKSSATLIARMLKKAELLDAGQLYAMMSNGRLKTYNPVVESQISPLEVDLDETPPSPQDSSVMDSYYPQPLRLPERSKGQEGYAAIPLKFASEFPG